MGIVCARIPTDYASIRFDVVNGPSSETVWTNDASDEEEFKDLPVISYIRCPPFKTKAAVSCMLASVIVEAVKNARDFLNNPPVSGLPKEILVELSVE